MSRKARVVDIPVIGELDRTTGNLSLQLASSLRKAIHKGELKAGDLLPSTRVLARALNVARGTVLEAFDQLKAEGFLDSQYGSGTRVARLLESEIKKPSPIIPHTEDDIPLSAQAYAFARAAAQMKPLAPVPFAVSVPALDTAPDDIWRRLGNRVRAKGPGAPSGYGDPQGALALREAICEYVRKSRSVYCTPQQIIITSGTQQGLYLATQILLDAGDTAWVEEPAYPGITAIFTSAFLDRKMVRIPVGASGIDIAVGKEIAENAKAAFVTPSHQYPLGMPMSMAQRTALLAWAKEHKAWIVEDDYDSEMRYSGHPFASLQGLDPTRVIYLGTFSKVLFPSLRLGYAIVPEVLVDAFCGARVLMDRHPPSADQYVLASFMAEGHLDRHIRKMRSVYAEKRRVLIDAIRIHIDVELAELQPCDQGMHMVLWLKQGVDDVEVVQKCVAVGISLRAVSPMYGTNIRRSGLFLGLGGYSDEDIIRAIIKLNEIIISLLPR
ncbi:PLP-dependent aminotransferase family protein [Yersinia kristensenii]|uniref:MocR-like pyridoxine biosynthesis transcription factor PdxR n=1 Tax=Yersinia kristensenii TaxID=28152 RepID=UPI001C60E25A|nr:PLP-dependent aminotransferase family protein [Yersinia kristensenii]MBW5818315.1 PLP-dependent aminotransferase family protein [Yersinia kristensenii]MBW5844000.1 PLP-dependent aminotransferase family protein [Yersinia kristensenii]MDA5490141.1 PLP-dependent aminotransferase family protein [Yersinia kristensenii]